MKLYIGAEACQAHEIILAYCCIKLLRRRPTIQGQATYLTQTGHQPGHAHTHQQEIVRLCHQIPWRSEASAQTLTDASPAPGLPLGTGRCDSRRLKTIQQLNWPLPARSEPHSH